MELLGIVFVTLVAWVTAMDPQPCCLPNKFSTTVFQVGATVVPGNPEPIVKDNYFHLNFDSDSNMMSMENHMLNQTTGRRSKVNLFYDYNTNKEYMVGEDGHCHFKRLNASGLDPPCIPADFHYAASFSVGSHDKSVPTNTFVGMAGQMLTRITTTGHCVPVVRAASGTNDKGNFSIYSFVYSDVQFGYTKVGAFLMPTACSHAMEITGHRKRELEELYNAPSNPLFL